jgi:hypothetical protein
MTITPRSSEASVQVDRVEEHGHFNFRNKAAAQRFMGRWSRDSNQLHRQSRIGFFSSVKMMKT